MNTDTKNTNNRRGKRYTPRGVGALAETGPGINAASLSGLSGAGGNSMPVSASPRSKPDENEPPDRDGNSKPGRAGLNDAGARPASSVPISGHGPIGGSGRRGISAPRLPQPPQFPAATVSTAPPRGNRKAWRPSRKTDAAATAVSEPKQTAPKDKGPGYTPPKKRRDPLESANSEVTSYGPKTVPGLTRTQKRRLQRKTKQCDDQGNLTESAKNAIAALGKPIPGENRDRNLVADVAHPNDSKSVGASATASVVQSGLSYSQSVTSRPVKGTPPGVYSEDGRPFDGRDGLFATFDLKIGGKVTTGRDAIWLASCFPNCSIRMGHVISSPSDCAEQCVVAYLASEQSDRSAESVKFYGFSPEAFTSGYSFLFAKDTRIKDVGKGDRVVCAPSVEYRDLKQILSNGANLIAIRPQIHSKEIWMSSRASGGPTFSYGPTGGRYESSAAADIGVIKTGRITTTTHRYKSVPLGAAFSMFTYYSNTPDTSAANLLTYLGSFLGLGDYSTTETIDGVVYNTRGHSAPVDMVHYVYSNIISSSESNVVRSAKQTAMRGMKDLGYSENPTVGHNAAFIAVDQWKDNERRLSPWLRLRWYLFPPDVFTPPDENYSNWVWRIINHIWDLGTHTFLLFLAWAALTRWKAVIKQLSRQLQPASAITPIIVRHKRSGKYFPKTNQSVQDSLDWSWRGLKYIGLSSEVATVPIDTLYRVLMNGDRPGALTFREKSSREDRPLSMLDVPYGTREAAVYETHRYIIKGPREASPTAGITALKSDPGARNSLLASIRLAYDIGWSREGYTVKGDDHPRAVGSWTPYVSKSTGQFKEKFVGMTLWDQRMTEEEEERESAVDPNTIGARAYTVPNWIDELGARSGCSEVWYALATTVFGACEPVLPFGLSLLDLALWYRNRDGLMAIISAVLECNPEFLDATKWQLPLLQHCWKADSGRYWRKYRGPSLSNIKDMLADGSIPEGYLMVHALAESSHISGRYGDLFRTEKKLRLSTYLREGVACHPEDVEVSSQDTGRLRHLATRLTAFADPQQANLLGYFFSPFLECLIMMFSRVIGTPFAAVVAFVLQVFESMQDSWTLGEVLMRHWPGILIYHSYVLVPFKYLHWVLIAHWLYDFSVAPGLFVSGGFKNVTPFRGAILGGIWGFSSQVIKCLTDPDYYRDRGYEDPTPANLWQVLQAGDLDGTKTIQDVCYLDQLDHEPVWPTQIGRCDIDYKRYRHNCQPSTGAYCIGPYIEGTFPVVMRSCSCNQVFAVVERLGRVKLDSNVEPVRLAWQSNDSAFYGESRDRMWDPILSAAASFPGPRPCQVWPRRFEDWASKYPERQRVVLREAEGQVRAGVDLKRQAPAKSFVKRERLPHTLTSASDKVQAPRLIQGRTNPVKVASGPFTQRMGDLLKTALRPSSPHLNSRSNILYASGATSEEMGEWYRKKVDSGLLPVESDGKRFDSHVSVHSESSWTRVMEKLGRPKRMADILKYRKGYQKGYLPCGAVYSRLGQRSSGDGDTTSGNTLTHMRMWLTLPQHSGVAVAGDNALSFWVPALHSQAPTLVQSHFATLGFPFDSDVNQIFDARFCSGRFYRVGSTWKFGPLPGRVLVKTFWSIDYLKPGLRRSWLRGVCLGLHNDCAHIPVLRVVVERIIQLTSGIPAISVGSYFDHKIRATKADHPTVSTYDQMAAIYGVEASVLHTYENLLSKASLDQPFALSGGLFELMAAVDVG